jgi:hypothetical protein
MLEMLSFVLHALLPLHKDVYIHVLRFFRRVNFKLEIPISFARPLEKFLKRILKPNTSVIQFFFIENLVYQSPLR